MPEENRGDSSISLADAVLAQESVWTRKRIAIRQMLTSRAPGLVALYEAAVELLHQEAFPGRQLLIAHCVREITNNLASAPSDEAEGGRLEYPKELNRIREKWIGAGLPIGHQQPPAPISEKDRHDIRQTVTLPMTIALDIGRLLAADEAVARRLRRNTELIFRELTATPLPTGSHRAPIIEQWLEVKKWFMGVTHFSPGLKLVHDEKLRAKFETLELILGAMVVPFLEVTRDLDKDLNTANENDPTSELVDGVIGKLGRPGAYRYFFSGLNNPKWIGPLGKRGFFQTPPPIIHNKEEGTFQTPDWPEAHYLARMAATEPAQIANIVASVSETDNVRALDALVEIALRLPPEHASSIAKRAAKWDPQGFGFHFFSLKLAKLIEHLASGGEVREAFHLAAHTFSPERTDAQPATADQGKRKRRRIWSHNDLWEYGEALQTCLPALTFADAIGTIRLLCRLLCDALFSADLVRKGEEPFDFSHMRAEDLEADPSGIFEIEQLIAQRLAETAVKVIQEAGDAGYVLDILASRSFSIFRSIEYFVLKEIAPLALDRTRSCLLRYEAFDEGRTGSYYAQLLEKRFGELAVDDRKQIADWAVVGPDMDAFNARYERVWGKRLSPEDAALYRKYWIRDRLIWLGSHRPPQLDAKLQSLVHEVGMPNDEPRSGKSWLSPPSPKADEEFNALAAVEVAQFLRGWVRGERDGTPAGLGDQLQIAARNRAQEFASAAGAFVGLGPTYVHHLLSGLDDAARRDEPIDWHPVLELCAWVVHQPRGNEPEESWHLHGVETSWIRSREVSARLIGDALEKGRLPADISEQVWTIIDKLAEDPDPASNEEVEGRNFTPTEASYNTIRGQAIRAVIKYLRWCEQNREMPSVSRDEGVAKALALLERHLDPKVEPTQAIRAVYGEYFAILYHFEPDWVRVMVERIFPHDDELRELWWAAWSSYVKWTTAYPAIFDVLCPQYELAVERLAGIESAVREQYVERLGSHIMSFYWRGKISLDPAGLMSRFMERATLQQRASALTFVGRSLLNTVGDVAPEILQRLKDMWQARVAAANENLDRHAVATELATFSWWFASGKFDSEWERVRLMEVIDFVGHDFGNIPILFKRLAEISEKEPKFPVVCLQRVITSQTASGRYFSSMREVRKILEAAKASHEQSVVEIARQLASTLAEYGDMSYQDLF